MHIHRGKQDKLIDFVKTIQTVSPVLGEVVNHMSSKTEIVTELNHLLSKVMNERVHLKKLNQVQNYIKRNKTILNPSIPTDIAKFMNAINSIDMNWWIWNFTSNVSFLSFIRALNIIFTSQEPSKMRDNIVNSSGQLDLILDHYIPLVGHNSMNSESDIYNIRLELAELLVFILTDYSRYCSRTKEFQNSMFDQLIDLMYAASPNEQIIVFRILIRYYLKIKQNLSDQDQQSFMVFLLRHSPRYSLVHFLSIKFILENAPQQMDWNIITHIIVTQGIEDHNDVAAIAEIMSHKNNKNPTEMMLELLKIAVTNPILARTAIYFALNSLRKYSEIDELRISLQYFIRNQFIYLFCAQKNNINNEEKHLTLDIISTLANLGIDWITKYIANGLQTFTNLKKCTKTLSKINISGKPDAKLRKMMKNINYEDIDVKKLQVSFTKRLPIRKPNCQIVKISRLGKNSNWQVRERLMLLEKMEMERIRKVQKDHWSGFKPSIEVEITDAE
ncbi:hypothetical protein TRFO_18231 [Tritrichomonas foetus]|uniref:Uncharacterized protein n=1 Tax=Tritrichomonas foetus TaxID=1144522 RepID=A0A1J4KLM7_9EUKA|nr:hypothetical protein TRFO_18231 [Tritrichomonas foetus]|eukprot:OHT12042.1 hypothetical protein TRFO_18231 [Tritrichomonas foetus]